MSANKKTVSVERKVLITAIRDVWSGLNKCLSNAETGFQLTAMDDVSEEDLSEFHVWLLQVDTVAANLKAIYARHPKDFWQRAEGLGSDLPEVKKYKTERTKVVALLRTTPNKAILRTKKAGKTSG